MKTPAGTHRMHGDPRPTSTPGRPCRDAVGDLLRPVLGWVAMVAVIAVIAAAAEADESAPKASPDGPGCPLAYAKGVSLAGQQTASGEPTMTPRRRGGGGYRAWLTVDGVVSAADTSAEVRVPLVVVGGSPYEMGWHLGRLMGQEIRQLVPEVLDKVKAGAGLDRQTLAAAWARTAAFTDDRLEQELLGLADGADVPLAALQAVHALPLLMPYSCSSIAAWGRATSDGHLYQTRNLDWDLALGAHDFPAVVLYLPDAGTPHLLPSFAGFAGANCGLSGSGIALSEMGYSPPEDMPYDLDAPHFTSWFRTILYDAGGLGGALAIFRRQPPTKRYQFVFGDGRAERKAVKIQADATPAAVEVRIWGADDPSDPLAPDVLPDVVYQDEGRGIFPFLRRHHGGLDGPRLVEAACSIPIEGANVLNVVFDATGLRAWIGYAAAEREAYQRPFVFLDLTALDGDGDGRPDIEEGGADTDGDGRPDFLDRGQ
jgi:isopenicillin-N N-acyltransferase-like protein